MMINIQKLRKTKPISGVFGKELNKMKYRSAVSPQKFIKTK